MFSGILLIIFTWKRREVDLLSEGALEMDLKNAILSVCVCVCVSKRGREMDDE